ncbi:uncharacterized protein TNCV_3194321 [Trichonephila clavipes]|uniref:Tc1-like transposase DDE domain-containing protein n=1 Tax=Trichonephila clavipes TaxID=2585209 RepID=A0A8X6V2C2_TRICX|nr:uncharacterized protein TNCV_3194321 [Trichonephila clavipes]
MNSIQGKVSQQDNARPHSTVVTRLALQSVDMIPLSARSPDCSSFEHVWDIIRRQLQHHLQPTLIVRLLILLIQQAWNSIPQRDIRHLYDTIQ